MANGRTSECPATNCKKVESLDSKLWHFTLLQYAQLLGILGILMKMMLSKSGG